MSTLTLKPIGTIHSSEDGFYVRLKKNYVDALKGLSDFKNAQILWWFDGCDNIPDRNTLTENKPYTNGPDELGVFATRSPRRPNPIALSCAEITYIDEKNGIVGLAYIDADEASLVLDIKPYTPSLDRVESPKVPDWCAHWPKSCEESGDFDWEAEFNF